MSELRHRLTKIRKELGYTQVELAKLLEIEQSVISRLENGNMGVSKDLAEKYAKVSGKSAAYVMYGSRDNNNTQVSIFQSIYNLFNNKKKMNLISPETEKALSNPDRPLTIEEQQILLNDLVKVNNALENCKDKNKKLESELKHYKNLLENRI